ncbi:MAG: hypothetical protein NDI61_05340 [Bdellovibrionaceae bacterium]|nr:hypothetical protein [Pseudobdellovibrionaceae bacterium]
MKNRATRVKPEKQKSGLWLPLVGLSAALVLMAAIFALVLNKQRGARESTRAPASAPPANAFFSYERASDQGDRVISSLECPGIRLCSVEIRENGKLISRTQTTWEAVEPFFVHYSLSPLMKTPQTSATRPQRILVSYQFKMGTVDAAGVIHDQSDFRRVLPYWDAMFLSFL